MSDLLNMKGLNVPAAYKVWASLRNMFYTLVSKTVVEAQLNFCILNGRLKGVRGIQARKIEKHDTVKRLSSQLVVYYITILYKCYNRKCYNIYIIYIY